MSGRPGPRACCAGCQLLVLEDDPERHPGRHRELVSLELDVDRRDRNLGAGDRQLLRRPRSAAPCEKEHDLAVATAARPPGGRREPCGAARRARSSFAHSGVQVLPSLPARGWRAPGASQLRRQHLRPDRREAVWLAAVVARQRLDEPALLEAGERRVQRSRPHVRPVSRSTSVLIAYPWRGPPLRATRISTDASAKPPRSASGSSGVIGGPSGWQSAGRGSRSCATASAVHATPNATGDHIAGTTSTGPRRAARRPPPSPPRRAAPRRAGGLPASRSRRMPAGRLCPRALTAATSSTAHASHATTTTGARDAGDGIAVAEAREAPSVAEDESGDAPRNTGASPGGSRASRAAPAGPAPPPRRTSTRPRGGGRGDRPGRAATGGGGRRAPPEPGPRGLEARRRLLEQRLHLGRVPGCHAGYRRSIGSTSRASVLDAWWDHAWLPEGHRQRSYDPPPCRPSARPSATSTAYRSMLRGAGPYASPAGLIPSRSYRDWWHGQCIHQSSRHGLGRQPRCGQICDSAMT